MARRILNADSLAAQGNQRGRQDMLAILEAGLQAADPYNNTRRLVRREGDRLVVEGSDFEPRGDPASGPAIFDLVKVGRVYVIGACKGVHRVAQALEDALGDRLTGGQIICKHGDQADLRRIGVTYGAHPVPDEGCVRGCERILDLCHGLREDDLVFTIAGNGVSALLTLPVPGVSLEDVRRTTYLMQIERGAPTGDLNPIRNHLDQVKGGRISRYLRPATAIHLVLCDPGDYEYYLHHNVWLHFLPEGSTFADAVAMLRRWDVWEEVPASVREHLLRADPAQETVKPAEFAKGRCRIFGLSPNRLGPLPAAQTKAAELGYHPHTLCTDLRTEASQAGMFVATIAKAIERQGVPFAPPCALFTSGELLVTVGQEDGVGGRNQEYALAAAREIAGSASIVVGAVDTDGTDGPGRQFTANGKAVPQLAGGLIDGQTAAAAAEKNVDLLAALRRHDASRALWQLDSGIVATQNISVNDLGVTLIGTPNNT